MADEEDAAVVHSPAPVGAPDPAPLDTIPLCAGLTIVTAVSQPEGDYESIETVESVDAGEVALRYSSERAAHGTLLRTRARRLVLIEDLASASAYLQHFHPGGPTRVPGTTAIGTSAAVLRALRNAGTAQLAVFDGVGAGATPELTVRPNIYDYQMVEPIHRVDAGPLRLPVIVNNRPVTLPAVRARGDYLGDKAEFDFLDDDENALTLRYRIGRDALDVVRITHACAPEPGAPSTSRLEQSLIDTGVADVYSIYFSFNSADIREESEPALKEIAALLHRRPDWRLVIGGHTDAVGGAAYNLALSSRRAAAVKAALVERHGIDERRLGTAGYGPGRPKDSNETLQGRARNRRVELRRE